MLFGLFLFSAVDTQAKYLTQTLPAMQVVWFRQLGLLAGVFILLAMQGMVVLKTHNLKLQISRGVLAGTSAAIFIIAIQYVPIADAVAVSFVAPFLVTILGALVLKENVGIRRWVAVSIGFIGMLIVVRPGLGVIHPAAGLVLIAAAIFALRQILSRFLSGTDKVKTTVAYTAIVSTALLTLPLGFFWITPTTNLEWMLLVSMSICAAVAETCVIKALEVAESVALAPMHYSLLIWGTMYGFLVFHQLPDVWTWLGAAIIMATGLYTVHREAVVSRNKRNANQ